MTEPRGPLPPDAGRPGVGELVGRLRLDLSPVRESPDFRRLWLAQTFSFVGSEAGYVALSYQLYALTNSTLAVGLLALAELVPMLTMTLVGGALADAFDRRRLMLVQQAGMIAGVAIALANALLPSPHVWPIYASAFVGVSAFAFGAGAQHSMTPRLVGEGRLLAANNLASLSSSLASVLGPALAGVFIGTVGVTGAYVLDGATFLGTLAAVWRLPALPPQGETDSPGLRSLVEGFRFVRSSRVIRRVRVCDAALARAALARARRRGRPRQRRHARNDAARADARLAPRPSRRHRVFTGRECARARQPRGRRARLVDEHPHVDRLGRYRLRGRLRIARTRIPGIASLRREES